MISILKLADEQSCMYMKCLAIQVRTYIHTLGLVSGPPFMLYIVQ